MSRKLSVLSLSAVCLAFAASPAAADIAIVGQTGQANEQGANSTQSGVNGTGGAGGDNSVIGDAAPDLAQNSTNVGGDAEAMGTGDGAMIANGPDAAFTQFNQTGTNSDQTGENGDSGSGISATTPMLEQDSTNATISAELMAATGNTVLIGGNAQTSSIGVNSSQSGNNFTGGGVGPFKQSSTNIVINAILLGG
ncbi:MAG TPA: hypothetical protein VHW26_02110 [Solirubrobacteraceae bacterium]|nr:hypothetical protein [Solirubrobacteraceae bacterium]